MGSGIAKTRNKIGKSTAFILFGYTWSSKPIVTGQKERAAIKFTPERNPDIRRSKPNPRIKLAPLNLTSSFTVSFLRSQAIKTEIKGIRNPCE